MSSLTSELEALLSGTLADGDMRTLLRTPADGAGEADGHIAPIVSDADIKMASLTKEQGTVLHLPYNLHLSQYSLAATSTVLKVRLP